MGVYLNPGNSSFQEIRNDLYVDKSGLIALINRTINTPQKLTCISRPRRFGKSYVAKMLCAYYDRTCDSAGLFDDLLIAADSHYKKHLNQYNIIYLDMTNIIGKTEPQQMLSFIKEAVTNELCQVYPALRTASAFDETLVNYSDL